MDRVGFGARLGAALIDGIIIFGLMIIIGMFFLGGAMSLLGGMGSMGTGEPSTTVEGAMAAGAVGAGFGALALMYLLPLVYSLLEVIKAASPGKMILGLRIRNADGSVANMNTLLTRWAAKNSASLINIVAALTGVALLYTVGTIAGLIIFIGCLFVLGAARQGFHDKLAHTAVYKA